MLDSEFIEKLKEVSPTITVLEAYAGSNKKLLCACNACGNKWAVTPSHLLQGRGCPACSRKRGTLKRTKSHEVFLQEVNLANSNVEIRTQYINTQTKVGCRCKKCGYEWESRPDHLINGIGCPMCAGNAPKTTASFVVEMNTLHPNIEILSEYLSADEKVECKCRICKKTWKAVPNSLLSGSGCPHCFSRYRTSFSEQAVLFYLRKYFNDVLGRYLKDGVEFDAYIQSIDTAIEYDGAFWHRNRMEHDNIKDRFAEEKGIRLIRIREAGLRHTRSAEMILRNGNSEDDLNSCITNLLMLLGVDKPCIDIKEDRLEILNCYYTALKAGSLAEVNPLLAKEWHPIKNREVSPDMVLPNSGKKFWWKCSACGFEWEASLDHRSRGRGCPACSKNAIRNAHLKTHEQFLQEVYALNTEITVLGQYSDSRTPIECKCTRCNREFLLTPHDILNGRKCPFCTKIQKSLCSRKPQTDFLQEIARIQPEIKILDSYTTAKYPVKCECEKCGHIWESTPDRLRRGAGCPKCAGNARLTHDEFVSAVLKQNPNIEILGKYQRSADKIRYKCKQCGFIGSMRASHLKEGHGCPQCARRKKAIVSRL